MIYIYIYIYVYIYISLYIYIYIYMFYVVEAVSPTPCGRRRAFPESRQHATLCVVYYLWFTFISILVSYGYFVVYQFRGQMMCDWGWEQL